jgi:hypothetical protein
MSLRGLLSFRFMGQDYVTYNRWDSQPKDLGAWIAGFAREHLNGEAAIIAFGQKIAALEWVPRVRAGRSFCGQPRGGDLLAGIAKGEVRRLIKEGDFRGLCLDCQFAYILDLDEGVLEFWDLSERIKAFPLVNLNPRGTEVMRCEQQS